MSFQDIFKKSFLEGWSGTEIGITAAISTIAITFLLAVYVFFLYQFMTRKTFYSKSFNLSLVGVSVITAAIILTVQSSVVVSLGMVGALSIVRFRTAIKDPMDLMFLFWSISIGIICGAGLAEIAMILSLGLTIGLFVLAHLPIAKAPMILVVNASNAEIETDVMSTVSRYARYSNVKSRNLTSTTVDLTVEVRTDHGKELVKDVMNLPGVCSAALLSHDGEVTF
ncbi:MAG: DUF4956 domain-containing protein [Clostridia bacterium]|nr:DUF4956 domain-containing protein [Clostridia bacterium]